MKNKNRTWVEGGDRPLGAPIKDSRRTRKRMIAFYFFLPSVFVLFSVWLVTYWNGLHNFPMPLYRIDWGWSKTIQYSLQYGLRPWFVMKPLLYGCISLFATVLVFRLFPGFRVKDDDIDILQGSAHFASRDEINELTGFFTRSANSVCLGGWCDPASPDEIIPLRDGGPENVLAIAPTRSGKGVGLVIPTLLSWSGSAVILDIKGENWYASAGWRNKALGPVLRFEPTDPGDACATFNILEEVRLGTTHETRDIQSIANLLIDPDGKGLDNHWAKTGFALMTGAITYCLYDCYFHGKDTPSLKDVLDVVSCGNIRGMLQQWDAGFKKKDKTYSHPLIKQMAAFLTSIEDRELSSVFSTGKACLTLYLDPTVNKNIKKSSFRIKDLVNHDKPVSLYIVVPPSDLMRLRPLLRLVVTQIIYALAEKMEMTADGKIGGNYKHRLLLMLDEFPQLRRLELLETALSYTGGFGIKAYLITQSYKQLSAIYSKDEIISSSCKTHVCFAPNDEETAQTISQKLGKRTVAVGSSTISGRRFFGGPFAKNQESISYSNQSRELMTPDEVKRLKTATKDSSGNIIEPGKLLVFTAGAPPIEGTQLNWFADPTYKKRKEVTPPESSGDLRNKPRPEDSERDMMSFLAEMQPVPVGRLVVKRFDDDGPGEFGERLIQHNHQNESQDSYGGTPEDSDDDINDDFGADQDSDISMADL